MLENSVTSLSFKMSCTSADPFSNLHFFFFLNHVFGIPFFPPRICKLTILEYVAVYSWSLQSTLTGIPLLENSNRVAIQFGASTWVNSMKPTEAELYHSLGDGGNEWKLLYLYKSMDTWHRCSPIQANKGQSKEIKMRSLLAWRCNTSLASIYRPIYYKEGGGGPEYFIIGWAALATPCLWDSEYSAYIFANSHQEKSKGKELKAFEPSEVKHDQYLGSVKINFTHAL